MPAARQCGVRGSEMPKAWETLFASNFIFERSIIREKLRHRHPDLYIDAGTSRFQILDFLKVDEILAAAEPAKERVKAQLARMLEAETLRARRGDRAWQGELAAVRRRTRRLLLRRGAPSRASLPLEGAPHRRGTAGPAVAMEHATAAGVLAAGTQP